MQDGGQRGAEVGARRQRRRADPLQDPVLAADHERDRHSREAGVRGAVAEHPREQHLDRRVALVGRLVAVERAEEEEEHQWEDEDEAGRLAVPPEDELLRAQLVCEDAHGALVDELEIDVLEGRAPHLDLLELASLRERGGRQLVERPRRLFGLEHDELAVAPVANLRFGARGQLRRSAELDDLAGDEHGHPIRKLLGFVEVVRGQQNRLAEPAQRADELPRVSSRGGIEPGCRLVEEDELGIADERDSEVEPALLAAGERLHPCVALVVEADEVDRLVHVARMLVVPGEDRVHLADGQARPELRRLEDDADPLLEAALSGAGIEAEHLDLAAVTLSVALEDLDGRRLAGAVRPEEAEDLTRRNLEVDPAHRLERAVGLAQAPDGDRRHARQSRAQAGRGRSSSATPAGGYAGGAPPVSSAAISPQSG